MLIDYCVLGTATYYQRLGLLDEDIDVTDEETNINILFKMALEKLVFMPFGYVVDKYRYLINIALYNM